MEVNLDDMEEKRLVLLKSGNISAFSEIYKTYVDQLYFFILKTAKSPNLTDDVVQDTFVKIWEYRSLIDPTKPFKPFLYTVARRHLLNVLKRASHESVIVEEIKRHTIFSENVTDLQTEYSECRGLLDEAINQLAPRSREVFVRCKIDGFSYKEVAEELGISEGTVNSQIVKATKSIKRFFSLRELLIIILLNSL
ncbi:RNA polymerase ECF-type sigma factor [Arcticibacter svalbardensis MN12-7]|uniref:RNA polymerase sigma factor n=2 Tax=Arcticibacter TaxID=1288026 RepID=R9GX05_9SPHI|nr:RNA polymerase ECF-type sigma factor [Arcticibacter svalbardensis MN12-7]